MDNKQILETLKIQPLSEDEKASRHILGRLYGPIATSKEGTRNGRTYNAELWNRQIEDEILQEKIANKSLFLELGHPLDREETDMEKVCACIPEMPKIIDGDLYAYVDILDTPNGRLLKTLIDYGFIPGISSRGSGDIMDNNEVDPETFFLETWDIVQLPAVKKARLAMCESVDNESLKMRKALAESLNGSNEKDKKIMEESLNNLNIKLDESKELKESEIDWATVAVSAIPTVSDDVDAILNEAAEDEIPTEEVDEAEENAVETVESEVDEDNEEVAEIQAIDIIKAKLDLHGDGNEIIIAAKGMLDDENAPKINVEVSDDEFDVLEKEFHNEDDQIPEKGDDIEVENSEEKEKEITADEPSENIEAEADSAEEEADDDGADEVIESLKEMVRMKEALESEVKSLKKEKTVSDAEVATLKEELNKYKQSFARISEVAANSKSLEKEVETLKEAVETKTATIKTLEAKVANTTKLTESINANESKVKTLSENLRTVQSELDEKEEMLEKVEKQYKAKLNEKIEIAKKYKAKFNLVLNRYIESKASMLGVRSTEITSRLNESYTLDDIDRICDELLTQSAPINRLPFGNSRGAAKVAIKESVGNQKTISNPDNGYEIDDDLLTLAGLK